MISYPGSKELSRGSIDAELRLRNEYLVTEDRIIVSREILQR